MGKLVSSAMARVGARLRAHREAAGLTQIQLCELLHLSDSWLSQVVRHEVACDEWYSSKEGRLMSTV